MKRVAVIGCSGAGKSTFSKRLGEATGLPVVHLDRLYWKPGWVESEAEEFKEKVEEVYGQEEWIIDGNFRSTMPGRLERADAVVLFDFPTWRCLWGAFSRLVKQRGQVRSDMAPGCPESFDWEFYQWIWRFRRDVLPKTLELLGEYPELRVFRVRDRAEAEEALGELAGAEEVDSEL